MILIIYCYKYLVIIGNLLRLIKLLNQYISETNLYFFGAICSVGQLFWSVYQSRQFATIFPKGSVGCGSKAKGYTAESSISACSGYLITV